MWERWFAVGRGYAHRLDCQMSRIDLQCYPLELFGVLRGGRCSPELSNHHHYVVTELVILRQSMSSPIRTTSEFRT